MSTHANRYMLDMWLMARHAIYYPKFESRSIQSCGISPSKRLNAAEPVGFDVVVVVNILSDVERRVEAIVAVDFSETKRPFLARMLT